MYEEQFLMCKFGNILNCAGVEYYSSTVMYVTMVVWLFFGAFAILFVQWGINRDKKQLKAAIEKSLANRKTK